MLSKTPQKYINLIPFIFIIIGLFLLWAGQQNTSNRTDRNYQTGLTNQFYNRLVACLASESPAVRTPEYTEHCYDLVESQTGVKAERYGTASR